MRRFAFLLPIMAGVFFGAAGVFVRTLFSSGVNNISIIFIRVSLGVVMLFFFLFFKDKTLLKINRKELPLLIVLGGNVLLTNITYNISCNTLSMAFAAVLLGMFPVYVLLVSRFLFGEAITRRKVICAILAIVGCFLVSGLIGSKVDISMLGLAFGLISGVSYGTYGLVSNYLIGKGTRGLTITFYSLLFLTIMICPFADYGALGEFIVTDPLSHGGFLIVHSLCMAVMPYICFTMAFAFMEAGKVSILASCEPAAAMVFGLLFFQETPTVLMVMGLILTLVALGIMSMNIDHREKE